MTEPDINKNIAKLLAGRLIERRDVKAIQHSGGAYSPHVVDQKAEIKEYIPVTLPDLVRHVAGEATFGHYLVSQEQKCRMFAFDIDVEKVFHDHPGLEPITGSPRAIWMGPTCPEKIDIAMQLRELATGLARRVKELLAVPAIVSYSGSKGMHVIAVLDPGTDAAEARSLARMVLDSMQCFEPLKGKNFFRHDLAYRALLLETYPKQNEINNDGFGNLLRLPLGINRKTSKRSFFIDLNQPPGVYKEDDPIEVLWKGSLR